jgi:threonine synthase
MRYLSTRGGAEPANFSEALARGLAPDGGLYVPETWPRFMSRTPAASLAALASDLLKEFLQGDALAPQLNVISAEAFNFPAPLTSLDNSAARVLELFHGPTAAFKDFGARFLAACLSRVDRQDARPLHILVATSGDTGGAVAAAFHGRDRVRVSVLYPKGLVSPAQERQLTCWGGNVRAFAVRGAFDDCQRLVKQAFADRALQERNALSSANSINVARLLPQMVYFAAASLAIYADTGEAASFVVPSGNLGHATACVWARHLGLPIGEIVLAHNANRTMPDYLQSGEWRPRATIPTLASAMDVGDPSNGERLRHLYPDVAALRRAVSAYVVDDDAIRARIRVGWEQHGAIWCPHTAAAAEALVRHKRDQAGARPWVIVATAHPAKFPETVEPIIGRKIEPPPALAALGEGGAVTEIAPDLESLRAAIG